MKRKHILLALFFYVCAVVYLCISTPISPHEAKIFYTQDNLLSTLMHFRTDIFDGFLGFRVVFLLFGFVSIGLFYLLSKNYFLKLEDAYLSTTIFMFLPGILTASTLVNIAIIVLPFVLFFILMYEKGYFWVLPFVMLVLFFIHETSMIFFVAVFLYALSQKEKKLAIASATFLIAFVILEKGIEIGGRPSGHFIEIFGLYASVFSPLLFLYFFYAMYRILLREKKTLLWYISFTALIFSLVLSIRQRVYIADFAPYVMIAIILMLDVFNRSIRVRLPFFKKPYLIGFVSVILVLGVSTIIIVSHQVSYYIMKDDNKHFAKRIYEPYDLAKRLKKEGLKCYDNAKGKEVYQLRYYGIASCSN